MKLVDFSSPKDCIFSDRAPVRLVEKLELLCYSAFKLLPYKLKLANEVKPVFKKRFAHTMLEQRRAKGG